MLILSILLALNPVPAAHADPATVGKAISKPSVGHQGKQAVATKETPLKDAGTEPVGCTLDQLGRKYVKLIPPAAGEKQYTLQFGRYDNFSKTVPETELKLSTPIRDNNTYFDGKQLSQRGFKVDWDATIASPVNKAQFKNAEAAGLIYFHIKDQHSKDFPASLADAFDKKRDLRVNVSSADVSKGGCKLSFSTHFDGRESAEVQWPTQAMSFDAKPTIAFGKKIQSPAEAARAAIAGTTHNKGQTQIDNIEVAKAQPKAPVKLPVTDTSAQRFNESSILANVPESQRYQKISGAMNSLRDLIKERAKDGRAPSSEEVRALSVELDKLANLKDDYQGPWTPQQRAEVDAVYMQSLQFIKSLNSRSVLK